MARCLLAAALILALVTAGCSSSTGEGTVEGGPLPSQSVTSTSKALVPATTTSTVAPTTTTTTTYLPREAAVTIEPATANLSISDASGPVHDSPGTFSGSVSGPVKIVASAEGYETESITLAPDEAAFAVWMDPAGQVLDKTLEFSTGDAPKQVAFRPGDNELWVTLLGGAGFEVYDPTSGTQIAAVDLPRAGSVEVIFNGEGSLAYISQMETASVYEVDADSKEVLRVLPTGGVWTKVMVLSSDEQTLWASNWVSNNVSEIDLASGEVRRILRTVATPRGLFVTPDDSKLYVAGFARGEIQVFDLATGTGTVLYKSGGAMRHLVGSPDGSLLYATDMAKDTILTIDTTTEAVAVLATVDRLPNTIDLGPDGRVLYVSNRGRNNPETYYKPGPEWGTVVVLDTATGAYLDAIVGGNQTTGLDASADGSLLAYSDFLDDRVVVYRVPSYEELTAGGGGRWEAHLLEKAK